MTPPWMLIRLALETSVHHAAADEHRLSGLRVKTVDDYRGFLARIFGFEAVVEQTLSRHLTRANSSLHARLKASLLREDLRALDVSERDLRRIPLSPALHVPSLAHGLGWMFVLERHTLVAGQLCRHVSGTLGTVAARSTSYLGARGDRPGVSFRAFGEALGELAATYPPALIVQGANEAFRTQRQWYSAQQREAAVPPRETSVLDVPRDPATRVA